MDDLAAFGMPADVFSSEEADTEDDRCVIDADNWSTVMVFLAMQTQWRREFAGMSGELVWHGLRYGEAATVINLLGYKAKAAEIFDGLRVMESAALPILNKR